MSDLIRRDDALKAFYKNYPIGLNLLVAERIEKALERVKAVDAVEVKHAHWKPHPIYPKEWDVCTSCGLGTKRREYGTNHDGTEWRSEVSYTYCPWCGAKMDGDK